MSKEPIESLTAVILAGGFGTRLQSVVKGQQKVVAKVSDKPFLVYLLKQLSKYKITNVVLCTGYKSEQVKDYFGHKFDNISIRYAVETEPLGTAGAIRNALSLIKSNNFIAMNGDSFCEANLNDLYNFHQEKNAKLSMLLTKVSDSSRYGSVELNEDSLIESFKEKESAKDTGWINSGIYILSKNIIKNLELNKNISIEKDFFPKYILNDFYGFKNPDGVFIDIGTPESYKLAEKIFT